MRHTCFLVCTAALPRCAQIPYWSVILHDSQYPDTPWNVKFRSFSVTHALHGIQRRILRLTDFGLWRTTCSLSVPISAVDSGHFRAPSLPFRADFWWSTSAGVLSEARKCCQVSCDYWVSCESTFTWQRVTVYWPADERHKWWWHPRRFPRDELPFSRTLFFVR